MEHGGCAYTDFIHGFSQINPKTGALNFYARSQMEGKLLHFIMASLVASNGSYNVSRLVLEQIQPGKMSQIVRNGDYFQLYVKKDFKGNYAQNSSRDCKDLLNIVRRLQSEGRW